jgi:hypothetical protein
MASRSRYVIILIAGLVLLLAPFVVRSLLWQDNRPGYQAPDIPIFSVAATPIPTVTPLAVPTTALSAEDELRTGPVIVDLAHLNRLNRSSFQPLAAELAARHVGLRFWLPQDIDLFELESFLDFPDQSEILAEQLKDASALVVVSPFFLWTPQEIALVEQFVAAGGRLLLISDPDNIGDVARDINNLAEPFGVVFNDDNLYDTVINDENHTHVFQDEFLDQVADLGDSQIVFYGTRSISGSGRPQVRSVETALSSLRDGLSNFTTMAIGGLESTGTAGGVLVMGDFNVLSDPYVERYDNSDIITFVADFLAGAQRGSTLEDFPAFLGKEVALVFGSAEAVDGGLLMDGSRLQRRLQETGRTMRLASTQLLTATAVTTDSIDAPDIVYLADYKAVEAQTSLFADAGVTLTEVIVTPTPGPTETPTPTPTLTPTATPSPSITPPTAAESPVATATNEAEPEPEPELEPESTLVLTATVSATPQRGNPTRDAETPEAAAESVSEPTPASTETPTPTPTLTPTPTITPTPTPTHTPTPEITLYLDTAEGLRLLASETVLLAQKMSYGGGHIVLVSGLDDDALRSGLDRLLQQNFDDCIMEDDLALCSYAPEDISETPTPEAVDAAEVVAESEAAANGDEEMAPSPDEDVATPAPGEEPTAVPDADAPEASAPILVIDDDKEALEEEKSEADIYLQALVAHGYSPVLWSTARDDTPTYEDLKDFAWVVWSDAAYTNSQIDLFELDAIFQYINEGGRVTISSRHPFVGEVGSPDSMIADVMVVSEVPQLAVDLPTGPIAVNDDAVPVTPLDTAVEEGTEPSVSLRRGPESDDSDAPLLFTLTDEDEAEPTGARLMVIGMSVTWLPRDFSDLLIRNMAQWMVSE